MEDKQQKIFRSGKELFESKGFKDTSVADIMKSAGYATGSFYRFYPSKDHLFMEIYKQENAALKQRIIQTVDTSGEPMAVLQEMMLKNLDGMRENPILREWYNRDSFQKIERSFRENGGLESVEFFYDSFVGVIEGWQKDNRMRSDISAEMIMAIFSALINTDLHKEEIGLQYFPEVMEHLGTFIMDGLKPKNT